MASQEKVKVNPFKKVFEQVQRKWEDLDTKPDWRG